MKNQKSKKYITSQVVAGVLVIGIMLGISHVIGAEETLYTSAKKAKIDWTQAQGQTLHVITPAHFITETIGMKQAKVFEKLTGAKVIWEYFPPEEAKTKSKIDLASGAGKLDVAYMPVYRMPEAIVNGWIDPFDPYLNNPKLMDREWFNMDDFFSAYVHAVQVNGKTYGFPTTGESSMLYYRKDIFEEKGLMVPQSWDDFMETAKKLYDPPKLYSLVIRTARGAGVIPYDWISVFRSFGGRLFADFPRDLTPVLNSPEGYAAMKYYVDLVKYTPPGGAAMDWPEEVAAAQQGLIAQWFDCHDLAFQIENPAKSKTAGKWGYAILPFGPGGRWPSFWSCYYPINTKSKNKVAGWLFNVLISSPQAVYERDGAERMSVWREVLKKGTITGIKGEWILPWAMALSAGLALADPKIIPLIPEYGEYADRIGIRTSAAITGAMDPKTAMDKLQEDFEKIFVKK